jgi:hypothetical protein
MNRYRPLEHCDRGFGSHSRHECLSVFILCATQKQNNKYNFTRVFFVRLLALRPLLTYCASHGWQWRLMWRIRWNVDWQGKPKFSEKTCPSAIFVHHKIPHDQTRVWIRAAAVGSRRLTAWAMEQPSRDFLYILSYGVRGINILKINIYRHKRLTESMP